MASSAMIHVRIDERIKTEVTETQAAMAEADEIVRANRANHNIGSDLIHGIDKSRGK